VVVEAIEVETVRLRVREGPVEEQAQQRPAGAAPRPRGDALEVDIAVDVVEIAQDGEGFDALARADEIGVARAGEQRLVLAKRGAADAPLVARRALDRHDRVEVGGCGGAKEEARHRLGHFDKAIARPAAIVYRRVPKPWRAGA